MRICHIIESTSGGSVRVALQLAQYQADQGHDVAFVYSPLRASEDFLTHLSKLSHVQLKPLAIGQTVGVHDLVSVRDFMQFLWKEGPFDVVHAHSSKAGGVARLACLLFPKTAVVYMPHAFITMSPFASKIYGIMERALSYVTKSIVAVSTYEKNHAVGELGISPEKVVVIPNAVEPFVSQEPHQIRQELGFGPKTFLIGFVGRLALQKNVTRLVSVASAMVRKDADIGLVVIGHGPEQALLEELIRNAEIQDKVRLLTQHEAKPYYAAFDVFLCTSDYEGFPLVFLESLVAGTPIVSTPVGGVHEAIVQGKTGFVTNDFSEESLVSCLEKIRTMPEEQRLTMRAEAQKHSQKFSYADWGAAFENLYRGLKVS